MSKIYKVSFPVLLVLTCLVVHYWQHEMASLPYLPNNQIVPLAVLTPSLLILTFFTTFSLAKSSEMPKAGLRSALSTLAMFLLVLCGGMVFLSYAARRYAGILPVIVLPDLPNGIVMLIISILGVLHLTALLACRLIKEKANVKRIVISSVAWVVFNVFMFLLTI